MLLEGIIWTIIVVVTSFGLGFCYGVSNADKIKNWCKEEK